MFDAIKDRKSDLALARLASDAFRKQFTRAEVTSIDKIVLSSSYQAQVLFTMKVAAGAGLAQQPATRSRAWRSCCARTTSCWCARTCCARPPSISRR